jgi:ferredoxin-NADP reductase
MAMIRHRSAVGSKTPARLLYSSRTAEDIIYKEELDRLASSSGGVAVSYTLTRAQPAGWKGYARRIDQDMVREVAWPKDVSPMVFICGPTSFVESAAGILVDLGYDPLAIKTERFGATGG